MKISAKFHIIKGFYVFRQHFSKAFFTCLNQSIVFSLLGHMVLTSGP